MKAKVSNKNMRYTDFLHEVALLQTRVGKVWDFVACHKT